MAMKISVENVLGEHPLILVAMPVSRTGREIVQASNGPQGQPQAIGPLGGYGSNAIK